MNIHQTLCFIYICKNGTASSIFQNIFKLRLNKKYKKRSTNVLLEPSIKKRFAKFKLKYRGLHLWNKFVAPKNNLSEVQTIKMFKKHSIKVYANLLEYF